MSNEPSQSTQQNNNNNDNPYELLGSALTGIQSSYSSVYSTLHCTLEQSVQMTQTMQQVLTHMFKTQVKIGTRLEYHEGATQLTITISNTTSFPVVGLTCQLSFKPIHEDTELPNVKWVSSKHIKLDQLSPSSSSFSQLSSSSPSLDVESLFLPTHSSSPQIIIHPNSKHVEVLHLQTPTMPTQYNGTIQIQIPIPCATNDSSSIQLTQIFGLYIIDQLKKSVIDNNDSLLHHHQDEEFIYPIQFFRDIMMVHPVLGIHKNMHLCLEPTSESLKNDQIICQVNTVSLEENHVNVSFFGKNKTLIDALVHELDMLKKI
ncbi:unnamed protein product [Cunninghamella blakesleeana]